MMCCYNIWYKKGLTVMIYDVCCYNIWYNGWYKKGCDIIDDVLL